MSVETILEDVAQYAIEHPEQTATAVIAIIGTVANYAKTGRLPIGRLPYRALRAAINEYGNRYFGKDRPKGVPGLVVLDADHEDVEDALRPRHFESADMFSYEYDGEVLNLRRPRGTLPDPKTGDPVPMETHVRTFSLADGRVLILAHDEANRFEATGNHLDGQLYSWEFGRETTFQELDDAGMSMKRVGSERDEGLDVVEDTERRRRPDATPD